MLSVFRKKKKVKLSPKEIALLQTKNQFESRRKIFWTLLFLIPFSIELYRSVVYGVFP